MRKKSQGTNQNEQMKSNKIGKAVLAWKNRTATPPEKKKLKTFVFITWKAICKIFIVERKISVSLTIKQL